jgi:hypothetical protein
MERTLSRTKVNRIIDQIIEHVELKDDYAVIKNEIETFINTVVPDYINAHKINIVCMEILRLNISLIKSDNMRLVRYIDDTMTEKYSCTCIEHAHYMCDF